MVKGKITYVCYSTGVVMIVANTISQLIIIAWWRHQMETFSALLAICVGEFPAQRPVTRSFDVFFDPRPNKRFSKQRRGWWFETQSRSLWRHRNENVSRVCDSFRMYSLLIPLPLKSSRLVEDRIKYFGFQVASVRHRLLMHPTSGWCHKSTA